MPKQIHFVEWDQPITNAIARFILHDAPAPLVRLDGVLIVVPTKEAGRRLREKMMVLCRANKSALLDARIVTPLFFIQARAKIRHIANVTLVQGTWIKTLLGLDKTDCPDLFPHGIPANNHQWAFDMAQIIQQLREDISDGGLSIGAVLEKHAADLQEPMRWRDLGKLEQMYLANLKTTGFDDPCASKLAHAATPPMLDGIKKIIMACVPDPSLLALKTIQALSKKIAVEILVMAPPHLGDHFDDWGRPLPTQWQKATIEIPAPEANIKIAANPDAQAQVVADFIQSNGYAWHDICIGVPDRTVIPYLQNKLQATGIMTFDPADRSLRDHNLYHLVKTWCQFTENTSFANLAAFLRQADVLAHLQAKCGVKVPGMLAELDLLQNKVLPQTMSDAIAALQKESKFVDLKAACKFAKEISTAAIESAAHDALRNFLERVFAHKMLDGHADADNDFKNAASGIAGILNDINYIRQFTTTFPAPLINRLIVSRLETLSMPRHHTGAMLDLNGWLELAWDDAPCMIITGCNEGCVPDSRQSDIFLPDSFKTKLGLRNDDTRFARDAYLLALMIAGRRQNGRVVLIAGKNSPEGDPLKPSRLLFRCPDRQLTERTALIFRETAKQLQRPPFAVTFQLNPAAPLADYTGSLLPKALHVTQFRDYLDCPFRFFLKHILRMKRTAEKTELDALDFGTMFHQILEQFARNRKISQSTDGAFIHKALGDMLEDHLQQNYGANRSFPILYAKTVAMQRLQAFAECQAHATAEGWEIVACELSCQLTIGGMQVRGKLDRIDHNRRSGTMRIIDYKTSGVAQKPAEQHISRSRSAESFGQTPDYSRLPNDQKEHWQNLQLPLYWHMLQSHALGKGKAIELCYFNLPEVVSGTAIELWEQFTPKIADSAYRTAEKIIELVRQGVFWPPSDSVPYDDFEALFNKDMRTAFDGEQFAAFIKDHWR